MDAGWKRVLVTGGGGFVGACLVRRLIDLHKDVHLLLRSRTTSWRLAALEGRCTTHPADLRDAGAVRQAVERCRPEVVFHVAAHGAFPGQRDRGAILASNVLGTANLLDALEDVPYRALVHTGSSSEYGHKDHPMRADDALEPRSDYGVAKAAATLLCQREALRGRPVCTVRIFSAYGQWDDPGRLVPHVMGCVARGEAPAITSGDQPRDWVHVDDVVDLLLAAAAATCRAPAGAHGQVLHAGGGKDQTVRDMVETILAVTGSTLAARYGTEPRRPDEPRRWVASLERTTALTGWAPRLDLRAGVARTWEWFTRCAATSGAVRAA
jgi:nucleoside-diphosphate-sugar epimerase